MVDVCQRRPGYSVMAHRRLASLEAGACERSAFELPSLDEGGHQTARVRYSLLALLSEAPKYGLQLRGEFETSTGHVWPLNVGQVYTTLDPLNRSGLIDATTRQICCSPR